MKTINSCKQTWIRGIHMCKLVDLELQNGTTVKVAENKLGRIQRYLAVFPRLKSVKRVILFGSATTEKCTDQSDVDLCFLYRDKKQYREDMAELYYNIMPESTDDDAMCADYEWFESTNMMTGAMKVAAREGVVIYDSQW